MRLTETMVGQKYRNSEFTAMRQINWIGVGLDDVSLISQMPNMETVAFSKNEIQSLQPFGQCKKLKELHLRDNRIDSFEELKFLQSLPKLTVLTLNGNPLEQYHDYRSRVLSMLPNLKIFDGVPVAKNERTAFAPITPVHRSGTQKNCGLEDPPNQENSNGFTMDYTDSAMGQEIGTPDEEQNNVSERVRIVDALEGTFRWVTGDRQLSREDCLVDMAALIINEMDEQLLGEVRGVLRRRLNYLIWG